MASQNGLLTYFKCDKDWRGKYVKASLFTLAALLLNFVPVIGSFIYMLALLVVMGWLFKTTNLRIAKPDSGLAEFKDFKKLLGIGFKYNVGIIIYTLLYAVLIGLTSIGVVYSVTWLSSLDKASPMFLVSILLFSVLVVLFILVVVAYVLITLRATISFSMDLKFASFFDFKRIKSIDENDNGEIVKMLLKIIAASLCFGICIVLSAITIVGPAFILIYFYMILAEIYADAARNIAQNKGM